MITVTKDASANLKLLKRLERDGLIEIHAVNIENNSITKKIVDKHNPIAVADGKFSFIGSTVIASNDTPHFDLATILGKQNHGDVLHLERHIESGRDVFVTEDRDDILSRRKELREKFGITILHTDDLEAYIFALK